MISLVPEGLDRYRVLTPFRFDDGDHLSIVLKRDRTGWFLTDEAHTYMHLSYDMPLRDLHRGTRQRIISNVLSVAEMEENEGELVLSIPCGQYGDSLFTFVQALIKITDVLYLSRERVRSTFVEDFTRLLSEVVPDDRRAFGWYDKKRDPQGMYSVDCRINGRARPLMVHALPNDRKTRDATISLLQFERWGIPFRSLAIFESQESINRKVLARFSDVSEKQFSSLTGGNRDRISRFLEQALTVAN
ncbi:MAG: DUF1828 domain-containing protein [bacterium]|nr:DUF1828 domain-containing protein [bacterium]